MDCIISETNKGKKCLLNVGYVYRIDNTLKDEFISWRCCNKKCKGRQKTDSEMTTIIPVTMDQNHDNNERRNEMQQLRASVKRKAGDDLTSRPSKLIRSELHKLDGYLLHSEDIRSVAVTVESTA
jgi:hypothetical protein